MGKKQHGRDRSRKPGASSKPPQSSARGYKGKKRRWEKKLGDTTGSENDEYLRTHKSRGQHR